MGIVVANRYFGITNSAWVGAVGLAEDQGSGQAPRPEMGLRLVYGPAGDPVPDEFKDAVLRVIGELRRG